jgi:hypothetical protein
MKIYRTSIGWLIGAFVWCIFMGIIAISIGFGALFPYLNYIAKPLACPNGQLSFEQTKSNPIPGSTITTAVWFCRYPAAEIPISIDPITMALYAGPFYGFLLFVLGLSFWYMNTRWASNTFTGKVLRRIEVGFGILLLALLIILPLLPLFK